VIPQFTGGASGASAPVITVGPVWTNNQDGTATVTWTTDIATDSEVNYGATSSYGLTATDASVVTSHSVLVIGLKDGDYHYSVGNTAATYSSGDEVGTIDLLKVTIQNAFVNPVVTASGNPSFAYNVTASSADTYLLVCAQWLSLTPNTVSAPTFNGDALTRITGSKAEAFYTGNFYMGTEWFYLQTPDVGNFTLTGSFSSNYCNTFYAGVVKNVADPSTAFVPLVAQDDSPGSTSITAGSLAVDASTLMLGAAAVAQPSTSTFSLSFIGTTQFNNLTRFSLGRFLCGRIDSLGHTINYQWTQTGTLPTNQGFAISVLAVKSIAPSSGIGVYITDANYSDSGSNALSNIGLTGRVQMEGFATYNGGLNLSTNSLTSISAPDMTAAACNLVVDTNSLTYALFPAVVSGGGIRLRYNALETVGIGRLVTASGNWYFSHSSAGSMAVDMAALTQMNPTSAAGGAVVFSGSPLATASLPNLTTIGHLLEFDDTNLTSLDLPALTEILGLAGAGPDYGGVMTNTIGAGFTSLTMDALQELHGWILSPGCGLTTFSLPALTTMGDGFSVNLSQNNLRVSAVNALLVQLDAAKGSVTTGTINLGTQTPPAAPTGAGATAKSSLQAAGITVTTD